tara:strand:- start:1886 stop:2533 length:648 start_codon:yes stop_codon:yes gene_type:complete
MAFKIQNLEGTLTKSGIAFQSHFAVSFTAPPIANKFKLGIPGTVLAGDLIFRCDQAEIPGRQVATAETRIYGPMRKIAYTQLFTDITISFICSHDLREKIFFDAWQEQIVGQVDNPAKRYDMAYYEDYTTDITIEQFDSAGNSMYGVTLFDALPTTVAPLPLNWATNEIHRVQISFAYHHWERVKSNKLQNLPSVKPGVNWAALRVMTPGAYEGH